MKIFYNHLNDYFISKIILALVLTVMVIKPAGANENQQVINALLHPQENDFFHQGREQFEREIQLLITSSHSAPNTLLKIVPEVIKIHERLLPLQIEKPQVLPDDTSKQTVIRVKE